MSSLRVTFLGLALAMAPTVPAMAAEPPAAAPAPAAPAATLATTAPADPDAVVKNASYVMGFELGSKMKRQGVDIDAARLIRGLEDGLQGLKPAVEEAVAGEAMAAWQRQMMAKMKERDAIASEKNKSEGDKFQADNAKKTGVKVTESGLQYEVMKEGAGALPLATDTVKVHYRGTLIDGTEFDSSYKRNEPATFPLGQVIPGFTEACKMMKVGSKYRFTIPSKLAYGERGRPPVIGPNATLVFELELIDIEKAKDEPQAPPVPGGN